MPEDNEFAELFKKPVEENTEEVQEETPTEAVEETAEPTEQATEEVTTEATEEVIEVPDYITKVNEFSGQEFKSDEDITKFFESTKGNATKVSEFDKYVEETKTEREAYKELTDYLEQTKANHNPLNNFGGDESKYKKYVMAEALVKQGKNPNVVAKLIGSADKLTEMSPLDVLSLNEQLGTSRLAGKDSDVKKFILEDIGVDVNDEDFDLNNLSLTASQQAKLEANAGRVETQLKQALESIEIPEIADPVKQAWEKVETRRETVKKLNEAWSDKGLTERLDTALDAVEIPEVEFNFEINAKDKADILKRMAVDAAVHGKEVNEENIALMVKAAKQQYMRDNVGKIMSAYKQQRDTANKEKIEKDTYNSKPINTKTAPEKKGSSKDAMEKKLGAMGII